LNFSFQYPQAFFLLALVPVFLVIYLFYLRRKSRAVERAGDKNLIQALSKDHSPLKNLVKIVLLVVAFVLGCVAVANPRRPDDTSGEARKGIDIVIALDVSNSMKAVDVAPDRLSRAKHFISTLIDKLQDDRLGLVIFAGNAYAQMPLTFDRDAAKMYTATANPANIAAQGTSIGDAFKKAEILFGDETERFRSIILITDGETHDDNAIEAAKELAMRGVMINTVGIGSPEGTTILDSAGVPKKDPSGQVVISKLNEQILKEIAAATNGTYVHLQSSEAAVKTVTDQYVDIEKKALGDSSLYTYHSFYSWLAIPMLLLLITEIFLPDRKKIKL